jgi:imidazolonepropionase
VLLPATMAFLGTRAQAPARRLIEAGAAVALASDLNPGSSPTLSLPLVMALGVSQLGLRHAEALLAVTVNAAAALGLAADRGQIAPGFRADLVAARADDWREVAYWLGANLVTAVWTAGSACSGPPGPVSLRSHVQA